MVKTPGEREAFGNVFGTRLLILLRLVYEGLEDSFFVWQTRKSLYHFKLNMLWLTLISHGGEKAKLATGGASPDPELILGIKRSRVVPRGLYPRDVLTFAHVISELQFGGGFQLHVFLAGADLPLQPLAESVHLPELIQKQGVPVAGLALDEGEPLPLHHLLILVDIFGPLLIVEEVMAEFSRMPDAAVHMLVVLIGREIEGGGRRSPEIEDGQPRRCHFIL
jgi:hypothetical protein